MTRAFRDLTLIRYLEGLDRPDLYGRVTELPETIGGWLAFIPATFPHYTRHTRDHSDEIIDQLGKLLFEADDPNRPAIELSPMETYVLVVSAYLHDAGMVCSDEEKSLILSSSEWAEFIGPDGPGRAQYEQYQSLTADQFANVDQWSFASSRQLRFVVADFLRRDHHMRSTRLFDASPLLFGQVVQHDPTLRRAIQSVCVGHGLERSQLDDSIKYPFQSDIGGEQVNIRLMAILLRLADLLDVRSARACPLLLPAVDLLPPSSQVHWDQLQRFTLRSTTPQEIRLAAECETQDEHRTLADWCKWIVDEVSSSHVLMSRSTRHDSWSPPLATMDGRSPTITIEPSPSATYLPREWSFQADLGTILQRLVRDVHREALGFLRELIQNGIDATRCRIMDVHAPGDSDWLRTLRNKTPEVFDGFPLTVEMSEETVQNPYTGESETVQVVSVDDNGMGMDESIIQDYFLQVGHSFYRSVRFRDRYAFQPIARFGIGFLSVFEHSDHVVVETLSSEPGAAPLKLTLTGPRSYLLIERGERVNPGTRISVRLRAPFDPQRVYEAVKKWCQMVEVPVIVDTGTQRHVIRAESPSQHSEGPIPLVTDPETSFFVRARPFSDAGLDGTLYVLEVLGSSGPRWNYHRWAHYSYPTLHSLATSPDMPARLRCLHGLTWGSDLGTTPGPVSRVDIREDVDVPLARGGVRQGSVDHIEARIVDEWSRWLDEHLTVVQSSLDEEAYWRYMCSLVRDFDHVGLDWSDRSHLVATFVGGRRRFYSPKEVSAVESLSVRISDPTLETRLRRLPESKVLEKSAEAARFLSETAPGDVMADADADMLPVQVRTSIFRTLVPIRVRKEGDGSIVELTRSADGGGRQTARGFNGSWSVCEFQGFDADTFALPLLAMSETVYSDIAMNQAHVLTQWWVSVMAALDDRNKSEEPFELWESDLRYRLGSLMSNVVHHGTEPKYQALIHYLESWTKTDAHPDLPNPPLVRLIDTPGFLSRVIIAS